MSDPYRLPRSVVPSRYDIALEPDLQAGAFTGAEDISIVVKEPVTEIVLNAKELEILAGSLVGEDGKTIGVQKLLTDAEAERLTVELAEEAEPGHWTLHLEFRGALNDRMIGFYRSKYKDDDGVEHTIATSHFEATDARMAFPCWDEPDLKAVFGIELVVPEGLTALSNGAEVSSEPVDGRVRVRFADTMPMSTYLVAMIVGPLTLTEPRFARGTPVRVACRPGREHLAEFALDAAVFCLEWFADYYAIPYPDAKVDNVAIPDFAQGAMENLGCVTYRETLLLLDPATSTLAERLDVAETIAHELAHMWFGDLVTMRWWNGIWLNEAFATFMSYLAVDDMHPEWHVWDVFARLCSNALEVDSLQSTRPIEYPVRSPDEASGMFDTLTYTKGGMVLRMLEQWLGPDRFRDGIRRYLAKHAYGNTETHDLWDAIEEETGQPVRRVMDAWIFQKGYPAVTVALEGERLSFSQQRYVPSDPSDPTRWPIPLVIRQMSGDEERIDRVLIEEEGGLELPLIAPDAVVVANAGASSFVRVFYPPELSARLTGRALARLSPVERQSVVDDAWAAVLAGESQPSAFLDLISGFRDETDPNVWRAIITGLSWCDRFVEGENRERFRAFVRELLGPALDRLGWELGPLETELDRELREELIRTLGISGNDPAVQERAREAESAPRDGIDPAVVAASIDIVAFVGGEDEYVRYRELASDASTPQEQARYREALARFRDPALMDRTLQACLTDEIRSQDAPFVVARSLANRDLGPRVWEFVEGNWDALTARFAPSNVITIPAGARYITEPETVRRVQAFFEEHDIPQSHLMLLQFMERQRVFAALRDRAMADLSRRFGP